MYTKQTKRWCPVRVKSSASYCTLQWTNSVYFTTLQSSFAAEARYEMQLLPTTGKLLIDEYGVMYSLFMRPHADAHIRNDNALE